jgi:hypothetical protein
MATGGLAAFRDNAVYMGAGKQSAWGTDVAPTWFYLWLDGSSADPMSKVTMEREGDGSGYMVLDFKEEQHGVVKVVEYARPFLAGYALQSLLGSGSDTYTAPTANTTLSANVLAGAATCSVVANLGNTGTLAVQVEGGYSSATAETVTLDLTTKTGTGPYVYTLAASATFVKGHSSGGSVVSAASHVLTAKYAFDPYTFEIGYGEPGALTQIIRFVDACCTDLQIESTKGKPVKFTHSWYATKTKFMTAGTATTAPTGTPFRHFDGAGTWKLNNLSTGNAVTIDSFKLQLKRSTQVAECQSESVNPVYFLPGNVDIDGDLDAVFNSWADFNLTYYGTTAPAANATDSNLVGESQVSVTYQSDAVNSLTFSLPTVAYKTANVKQSLKGGAVKQPIKIQARKTAANPVPLTVTLLNGQVGAY